MGLAILATHLFSLTMLGLPTELAGIKDLSLRQTAPGVNVAEVVAAA